jgi:hypothetical protein
MLKMSFQVLLTTILSLTFAGAAYADRGEGGTTARQGVVRCGGNNFLRLNGTEIHLVSYTLRNFDSGQPIIIERLRFFDATGAVLFDTAGGPLPPADNGVLGPANNALNPDQTAQFSTDAILPFLDQAHRPIQLEIEWSAARRALTLDVIASRIVRQRDAATGGVQEERARSATECRSIRLQ